MPDKLTVENINVPGRTARVDAAKYHAILTALLDVLPYHEPGMVVKDAIVALKPKLPETLFPSGATVGWWQKTVQLDLEAKGLIRRLPTKPIQIMRTG
ncbi:MAG: hypothetical protein AAF739_09510 [Pseudomonadota bacterium]